MVARVVALVCDTDEPCESVPESCSMYVVVFAVMVWFCVAVTAFVVFGMIVVATVEFTVEIGVLVVPVIGAAVVAMVVPGDADALWFAGVDVVVVHPAQNSAAISTSPIPVNSLL
ncbi:hypothetical protein [Methanosphaerula palustris]|nr:hypothetical protein [Methanosphaerula palustris]